MDFSISSEIHFYDMQTIAVRLQTTASDEDLIFAEQLLYCCITMRQLVSMMGDPFADRLIYFLLSVAKHPHQLTKNDETPYTAVEYSGTPAKKHFAASLDVKNSIPKFTLLTKGLGILEKNLRFYAVASVMVLYNHLVKKDLSDRDYQSQIAKIGSLIARIYHSGQLSITNQTSGALQIVNEVHQKLI